MIFRKNMIKANKKICMVVLNDFTHDSRVLREARALADAGYEVFVIALYEKNLKREEIVSGFKVIRIDLKSRRFLEKTNIRLVRYLEFMCRVFWQIGKIRPLVCHCNDFNTLPIGYLAKKIFKNFLVYDSHELESQKAPSPDREPRWFRWGSRKLEHFLIKKANKVITVGDCIADYLVKQDNVGRPVVIRNIPEIPNIDDGLLGKEHFGFDKNKKIVVFNGGLQIGRGLINLIRAMKFLDKNIILVFIGDGPFRKELEKEVINLNLQNRIIFKGWVSPQVLLQFTSQGDLGVEPPENISLSYYYGLGNKVFEYIVAGLPIAVSDFPDMAKIVKEHQIGETFNPADPKDIAMAIQSIFQDEVHYQALRQNVIKARKILNWNNEKQKLINLYKNLILHS